MTNIIFNCRCPCIYCRGDGPKNDWTCARCNKKQILEDTGKIICLNCENSLYLWRTTFKCGNRDNESHPISYNGMIVALSDMGSVPDPPREFLRKLTKACLLHVDDFLEE